MSLKKAVLLIFIILLLDQASKIYIKTNFVLGEEVTIFSWFKLHFVENKGMAWGIKIPGPFGKLLLTVLRLVAVCGIGYWLWDTARKQASSMLVVSIALVFVGAFGNILDSVFYGLIFEDSYGQIARAFPADGGYESLFHGRVVDMFSFSFFDAVFNLADVAIFVGMASLIIFYLRIFQKKKDTSTTIDDKTITQ